MAMDYWQYIVRDPAICGGEAVVNGTTRYGADCTGEPRRGVSVVEIVKDFPTVDEEAVRAIIAFAAASAEEDLPIP